MTIQIFLLSMNKHESRTWFLSLTVSSHWVLTLNWAPHARSWKELITVTRVHSGLRAHAIPVVLLSLSFPCFLELFVVQQEQLTSLPIRKQSSDTDSCVKCQSFPEELFSVMRKPKPKLSKPDAAEASWRGTTSADAPVAPLGIVICIKNSLAVSLLPGGHLISVYSPVSPFLCQSSGRKEAWSESSFINYSALTLWSERKISAFKW